MKCTLCNKKVGDIDTAIENGWIPSFFCDDHEYDCVCPHCSEKYLQFDNDGEWEIKPDFKQTFLDSASSVIHEMPLAEVPSAKSIYPDRELIKRLRGKFLEHKFTSLSSDEAIDLINHQHQLIADLDVQIEDLREELQTTLDDF